MRERCAHSGTFLADAITVAAKLLDIRTRCFEPAQGTGEKERVHGPCSEGGDLLESLHGMVPVTLSQMHSPQRKDRFCSGRSVGQVDGSLKGLPGTLP